MSTRPYSLSASLKALSSFHLPDNTLRGQSGFVSAQRPTPMASMAPASMASSAGLGSVNAYRLSAGAVASAASRNWRDMVTPPTAMTAGICWPLLLPAARSSKSFLHHAASPIEASSVGKAAALQIRVLTSKASTPASCRAYKNSFSSSDVLNFTHLRSCTSH